VDFRNKVIILSILGIFLTPIAFFMLFEKRHIKYMISIPVFCIAVAMLISFMEFNNAKKQLLRIDQLKPVEMSRELQIGARPFFISAYVEKNDGNYFSIKDRLNSFVPLYTVKNNCEKQLVGWLDDPKPYMVGVKEGEIKCGLLNLEIDAFLISPFLSENIHERLLEFSNGQDLNFIRATDSRATFKRLYDKEMFDQGGIFAAMILGIIFFAISSLCAILGDYFNMPNWPSLLERKLRR